MSVFFWIVVILAFYDMRVAKKGFFDDCVSYNNIQPIKGIFLLLVLISHFVQYVNLNGVWDAPYFEVRRYLGQMVVVPFLFYSGYGIAESIRKKGVDYVKSMPAKRILKVLFQFAIAVLCFLVLRYAMGSRYAVSKILLSFVGWESLGNSNWYIFAILAMYIITWFSYLVFRKGTLAPLVCATLLTVAYIVVMKLFSGKDECWCNTVMAYIAGMWFSSYRQSVFKGVFSSEKVYWGCLAIVVILFAFLRQYWSKLLVYELVGCLFAAIMVLITAKVKIQNKFLAYCGEHLFSLFILQRIPMIALNNTAVEQNVFLYFTLCVGITFLLAWAFDTLTPMLWNVLTKPRRSLENGE